MAIALREGRVIRGQEAIAERPDGSRVWLASYPTPLRDEAGKVIGGVNMLVDITERKRAEEASARLAAIVESSSDAIVSKDLNGTITSWNRGAERVFGYTAPEAIGQPVTMLIPSDRLDEEVSIIERIRRGERIEHYETIRRHKDGTLLDVSLTVSPIYNAQGHIVGASKIARDITERKRAQQAIRKSEERFRSLVSVITNVTWTTDCDGRFVESQAAWSAYTGQSWDEYRDFGWANAIHPDDREVVKAAWQRTCDRRSLHESSGRLWHAATGQWRHFAARAIPLFNRDGTVREWVGSVTDIHEQKQAEEALKEADRRKDEFLGMLAHELRNPLAVIANAGCVLDRMGSQDAHAVKLRGMILRQAHNLARMVDDLLDVSRISRGKISLAKEIVELGTILGRAVETIRPFIESRRQELVVSLGSAPMRLEGDTVRLEQIIVNLLNNAAKYTEPGGTIRLSAAREDEQIVIRVRDNGVGIPAEMLTRIFDLFTQVDDSLNKSQAGLGIGLSLVRTLVELHGGLVIAHSDGRGTGSEFVVRLPALPQQESPPMRNVRDGKSSSAASPRMRVLVVDDNPDVAECIRMLLQVLGHDVRMVHSGAAAIAAARAQRPDMMLIDIGMPAMNGYELARQLRADPDLAEISLIALTGYGQAEDRRRSREAGFVTHLVKPVSMEAVEALFHTPQQHAATDR